MASAYSRLPRLLSGRAAARPPSSAKSQGPSVCNPLRRGGIPGAWWGWAPGTCLAARPRHILGLRAGGSAGGTCFATSAAAAGQGEVTFQAAFGEPKVRLDAFLNDRLSGVTRSKIQDAIKGGHVLVNGRARTKPSYGVAGGDKVACSIPPPPPLAAEPEEIPIEVVYEDDHLLVVNKQAHLVVHPAAGHPGGTLVNAVLYHCGLPAMRFAAGNAPQVALTRGGMPVGGGGEAEGGVAGGEDGRGDDRDMEDGEGDDGDGGLIMEGVEIPEGPRAGGVPPVIRPGIVHRLDKGTSGLIVVAKEEPVHAALCDQFKAHTVSRKYHAVVIGLPEKGGRVETVLGRDLRDRLKMAAFPLGSEKGRWAASNYRVLEVLAGGQAALVEWVLETGRTHQIRVHSQHIGHSILGDDTYGGGAGVAADVLGRGQGNVGISKIKAIVARVDRPLLHAKTLGYDHPVLGERQEFNSEVPEDFAAALKALRELGGLPE